MLNWLQALMPKEEKFFDLFEAHAKTLVLGAEALRDVLKGGEGVTAACHAVARYENEADGVAREVMLAVRRSFITPFDRSDIHALISSMDDAIDQMHKTAKAITLYEVRAFAPDMQALGDIIVRMAGLTAEATPMLRNLRANSSRLNALSEQIATLEEESDQLHDAGLATLFKATPKDDALSFIIGAEIYEHLEKVADRFEDVANRMSSVLIEHL
ncbi:DUF47 domain-containing protein [Phenylobacterium sp.]|uniref:DUF47 domain-containing protein n=1 Tax=Phenylobacterium sp. TaxID=1871053 RepID=UPI0035ADF0A9